MTEREKFRFEYSTLVIFLLFLLVLGSSFKPLGFLNYIPFIFWGLISFFSVLAFTPIMQEYASQCDRYKDNILNRAYPYSIRAISTSMVALVFSMYGNYCMGLFIFLGGLGDVYLEKKTFPDKIN